MSNRILKFKEFQVFEADINNDPEKPELPEGVTLNKKGSIIPGNFFVNLDKNMLEITYVHSKDKLVHLSFYMEGHEDGYLARAKSEDPNDISDDGGGYKPIKDMSSGTGQLLSDFLMASGQISKADDKFMVLFVKILQYFSLNEYTQHQIPTSYKEAVKVIKKGPSIFDGTLLAKQSGKRVINRFFELLKA